MIKFLFVVFCAIFALSQACVVTDKDGKSYDLGSLKDKIFLASIKDNVKSSKLSTSICGKPNEACTGATACVVADDFSYDLLTWDENTLKSVEVDRSDPEDHFLKIDLKKQDVLPSSLTYRFKCGTGEPSAIPHSGFDYVVDIYSEDICSVLNGGGMSGGWVFIIILIVAISLYLIIGFVYAIKVLKRPFAFSSLPGSSYITTVFALALAGVNFIISKITGKSSSSSSNDYQSYGTVEEV